LNQIGHHATCLTKHKYKNQHLAYQQAQQSDLIGFQIVVATQGSITMKTHT